MKKEKVKESKKVLNLFDPIKVKELELNHNDVFLLRELLRFFSSGNKVDSMSMDQYNFRFFYLSLKIKAEDWGYNERTLAYYLKRLEKLNIICRTLYQHKKIDSKTKCDKYIGKKHYFAFIPSMLEKLLILDTPENERIKYLLDDLLALKPDYDKLKKKCNAVAKKQTIKVETQKGNKSERFDGLRDTAVKEIETKQRKQLNNAKEEVIVEPKEKLIDDDVIDDDKNLDPITRAMNRLLYNSNDYVKIKEKEFLDERKKRDIKAIRRKEGYGK